MPKMITRSIAILALDDFVPFDFNIPHALFSMAKHPDGGAAYNVWLCGPASTAQSGCFRLNDISPLSDVEKAHTLLVPGIMSACSFQDDAVMEALRHAAAQGTRIASICTGAFILAASGLLAGLRATTHWEMAEELALRYENVRVEPDILFVDNGQILTSAGLASGIDLCLHLIRKDLGATAAERCAQFFVIPAEREAGHAQRTRHTALHTDDAFSDLQQWLVENIRLPHTLQSIAGHACISVRTLNRKFKERTGAAPMLWLMKTRVRRAQALLESSDMSVEEIATATGSGSATALRDAFRRNVGVSPTAWRKTYKGL